MRIPGADGDPPYFFLAYAHTSEQRWVKKLYDDLCTEIQERTSVPLGTQVGFMDHLGIPFGENWRDEVLEALATCRVFIPLYSPRYFSREECGREWFCFAQRILDHRAKNPGGAAAMVPALWTPVDPEELPEVARRVQANHAIFGSEYAREGLYTLIKNSTYQDAYTTAVQKLAQQIIRTAEQTKLHPFRVTDFGRVQNAFEPSMREVPADRRLTVVVAAPTIHHLPAGRSPDCYGSTATDWNPWQPITRQSIGDYAMEVARWHAYQPTLISFEDDFDSLLRAQAADGLGILLVDAWLVDIREMADKLSAFDDLDLSWIGTMVPFNRQDPETRQHSDHLWEQLNTVLRHRLGDPRVMPSPSTGRVTTPEQFQASLPQVLEHALQGYLTHAQAHPPQEPFPPRPVLSVSEEPETRRQQGPTTAGGTA